MKGTKRIVMVRPHNFYFNRETAKDNIYQNMPQESKEEINKRAREEFDQVVRVLRERNIEVNILEDDKLPLTPDSIFVNNWFSTHDGILILYPMYAKNRRDEIGKFKDQLMDIYKPGEVISLVEEGIENEKFLESTGSMVFDRENRKIYSSLSERSDPDLIKKIGKILGYEPIIFKAKHMGKPIYHTNVLMSITEPFSFISLDLIEDEYRDLVYNSLKEDREVINLSGDNIENFAGNMIELSGDKPYLLMSNRALNSLSKDTLDLIEGKLEILSFDVSTIEEVGGGSIRCMVGEVF